MFFCPVPATDDDSKEQEGAHDDSGGSSGKGCPLDIDEGEPPIGLNNRVFSVLCLSLAASPLLSLLEAGDVKHFS